MTKYLFLTTIFAINHAGRQEKKMEVSPTPSGKSQGISSNGSSRNNSPESSEERIRKLEEQNTKLLITNDTLRDKLAAERAERIRLENELKANPIQLPDSTYKIRLDEVTYDLHLAEEQLEILEKEIRPHYKQLVKENKALKAQLAQTA